MRASLAVLSLIFAAPLWAAAPASGELSDVSGPLVFTGGPFIVPNPTSDVNGLAGGPVVCEPMLMHCDEYALTVAIPEKFRKNDLNKKEIVQIALTFTAAAPQLDALADYELYVLDAAGEPFAESVSGQGVPETISLPLSQFPDGDYTVRILNYQPLGGSYSTEVRLGRGGKSATADAQDSGGLLIGAFGIFNLLLLGLFAVTRRQR